MKIVFMGTPAFAVPTLRQLCEVGMAPAVVYAQPPRKQGRGLKLIQPPTACAAEDPKIPVRQPAVLQQRAELTFLKQLAPDLIVTA
ncbi:MAG: methionyl-tRNA formyltransferase, partial [Candidatus Eisenbacteria sp.]|nr:methionyl-tRNA formyltransferase [Candidatus Eisenbacteria bacterium]